MMKKFVIGGVALLVTAVVGVALFAHHMCGEKY